MFCLRVAFLKSCFLNACCIRMVLYVDLEALPGMVTILRKMLAFLFFMAGMRASSSV